jgi:hypothetical protein
VAKLGPPLDGVGAGQRLVAGVGGLRETDAGGLACGTGRSCAGRLAVATGPTGDLFIRMGLFDAWYGLSARLASSTRRKPRRDPRFLLQAGLLSVACTMVWVVSGLLWAAVVLH